MKKTHKPEGHSTVSPYLVVAGASGTIEFLKRVFGGIELARYTDAAGKILHAEVRIDDTVVMLGDSSESWPPMSALVHVYVPDVDATYARALEAGAHSIQEPVKNQDPDKRGIVKDPIGTAWCIATRLE